MSFEQSGDEQLDLVLKKAERLAAQMRSVSTASNGDHNDEGLQPPEHTVTALDTSPEASDIPSNVNIPDQLPQEDISAACSSTTLQSQMNALERSSLRPSAISSTAGSSRDIDVAVRASEEMANALRALGATSSAPDSSPTPTSAGQEVSDHSFQHTLATSSTPDSPMHSTAPTAMGPSVSRPLHLSMDKDTAEARIDRVVATSSFGFVGGVALSSSPDFRATGSTNSVENEIPEMSTPAQNGLSSEADGFSSDTKGDPSTAEVDGASLPRKFYSTLLSTSQEASTTGTGRPDEEFGCIGTKQSTALGVDELGSAGMATERDSGDGWKGSKSRELKEKLRQTEAQFAILKARKSTSQGRSSVLGQLEQPDTVAKETPNWLNMATTSATVSSPEGAGELTWDNIEEPRDGDEDYVPLRDYSSLSANATKTQPDTSAKETSNWLNMATMSAAVSSPQATGELTWDNIEEPKDGGMDYVPLRDYSSLSANATKTQPDTVAKETPNRLNMATMSAAVSSPQGTAELTWDNIAEPKDGDEDYVPLRDYSSLSASATKPQSPNHMQNPVPKTDLASDALIVTNQRSSVSQPNSTKVKEPKLWAEDYVPLRGHTSAPVGAQAPPSKTPTVVNAGSRATRSGSIGEFDQLDTVPLKDYTKTKARKLRTPSDVTWETVDYANQDDDDYVHLKDYSRLPGTPTMTSSAASSEIAHGMDQYGEEDEFEMAMATYRSINSVREGPTVFALNRNKRKRRKKMIRLAAVVVVLLAAVGVGYYISLPSSPPALKRPHYKSKTSQHSHRTLISSSQQSLSAKPQLHTQIRTDQSTEPQVHHQSKQKAEAAETNTDMQMLDDQPDGRASEYGREQDDSVKCSDAKTMSTKLASDQAPLFDDVEQPTDESMGSPPKRTGSQLQGYRMGSPDVEGEADGGHDPHANICYVPFGYLFAEKCHETKRPKRLDSLLQSMFQ